jgi:hypothetical protein
VFALQRESLSAVCQQTILVYVLLVLYLRSIHTRDMSVKAKSPIPAPQFLLLRNTCHVMIVSTVATHGRLEQQVCHRGCDNLNHSFTPWSLVHEEGKVRNCRACTSIDVFLF